MTKKIITGQNIYLRLVEPTDATNKYLSWLKDKEVNQFLETRFQKWTVQKIKNYIKTINKNPGNIFLAIIKKDNQKHIGNVKIGPIDKNHKSAEISLIIGDKSCWGKGFGSETINLICNFAFCKLRLHKLTSGAYANNPGSIKAFLKCGFAIEGVRKKQYKYKKSYVDAVLLGKLN
jgi:RimJ/RimL family protein N-acetyltransferase